MKGLFIGLVLLAAVCIFNAVQNHQAVTREEFTETHKRLTVF